MIVIPSSLVASKLRFNKYDSRTSEGLIENELVSQKFLKYKYTNIFQILIELDGHNLNINKQQSIAKTSTNSSSFVCNCQFREKCH